MIKECCLCVGHVTCSSIMFLATKIIELYSAFFLVGVNILNNKIVYTLLFAILPPVLLIVLFIKIKESA